MIKPEELSHRLKRRPFQPFYLHLTDGRVLEVRYPDMNIVGTTFFMIGIPEIGIPEKKEPDPFADRFEVLDLSSIREVVPFLSSAVQLPA